jgi:hypothetical protein
LHELVILCMSGAGQCDPGGGCAEKLEHTTP